MLAPLKDRSVIEREEPAAGRLAEDNANLRIALRLARREHKRAATVAARKIVAQENELNRLRQLLEETRQRLAALESGQAIIELGRRLMQLSERNDELICAAQRLWTLDKTLCAAQAECQRLARERDCLAGRLACRPPAPGTDA